MCFISKCYYWISIKYSLANKCMPIKFASNNATLISGKQKYKQQIQFAISDITHLNAVYFIKVASNDICCT